MRHFFSINVNKKLFTTSKFLKTRTHISCSYIRKKILKVHIVADTATTPTSYFEGLREIHVPNDLY